MHRNCKYNACAQAYVNKHWILLLYRIIHPDSHHNIFCHTDSIFIFVKNDDFNAQDNEYTRRILISKNNTYPYPKHHHIKDSIS